MTDPSSHPAASAVPTTTSGINDGGPGDVHTTAILTPSPGKSHIVQKLLSDMCSAVHAHESLCRRYLMTTELNGDRIVMIEQYADKPTQEGHSKTEHFGELFKHLDEGLLSEEPVLIFSTSRAGFDHDRNLITT